MEKIENKVFDILNDTDEFLSRIFYCLLPEGYKHERGDVFYISLGYGLELQYKIDISDLLEDANVIVFENHLDRIDISKEDVIKRAYDNTRLKLPPRFESVCEILGIDEVCDMPLYCLTNERKTFGAGVILYPDMKRKIESIIGDFIVIPSSIHEVLLFPTPDDVNAITDIVKEVNKQIVEPSDVLSNKVFKLISDKDLIEA